MMTLRAISAFCLLACLATATAPTTAHTTPKLVLQRRTQGVHAIPWATTTTSKVATTTADNPTSSTPLPETAMPALTEDLASSCGITDLETGARIYVRPRYRHYYTSTTLYTAKPLSSPVSEMDSNVEIKAASNSTSTPASSIATPATPIWETTSSMTCAATGGWYTGPWGSLAASDFDPEMPAPDVTSTPSLGKYRLVVSEGLFHAWTWYSHVFVLFVVWGVFIRVGMLGQSTSNDKPTVVVAKEEETVAVEDDDAAEFDNAIGVPNMDVALELIKTASPKKGFGALLTFITPGGKGKMARRHSAVYEGDALSIFELIRRNSAPAALNTTFLQHLRQGSMTEEDRVRSESNQPRLGHSLSVNVDVTAAAAAAAALVGKEGEDTPAFANPNLFTPSVDAGVEELLGLAAAAGAAQIAFEAEAHARFEATLAELNAQGIKPTKMGRMRAAFGGAFSSAKKLFKGGNKQDVEEFILADEEIKSIRTDIAAFRFNSDAIANRKAALRAAANPIVAPTPVSANEAAAAAAAAAEVEVQAPAAPPPRPRRRSSCSAGMFPCHAVMVLDLEDEIEVVAAPARAPVVAAAAPSRSRSLSDVVLGVLTVVAARGGGSLPSFGVVETAMLPTESEGEREEEVVEAPVEEEEEEEEVEHELPIFFFF